MGLASTFTNSIVREIGRNYGKSISNDLLGDSHSTPVRMVGGSSSIARKRGRKYENKLDEYLQKFEIKGALATFNQGQNIFNAYFELDRFSYIDLSPIAQHLPRLSLRLFANQNRLLINLQYFLSILLCQYRNLHHSDQSLLLYYNQL